MISDLLLLLFGSTLAVPAQQAAGNGTDPKGTIVVTGIRLQDSERALKACIARHCPPNEEIDAALSHAENQFVAGDYKQARATLLATRNRTQRFAKQYPVDVSDLLRAESRIDLHLGEGDAYRSASLGLVSALKAGLPADDPRVLAARIELGDSYVRFGEVSAAVEIYRAVAKRAAALELPNIKGYALFHELLLYSHYAEVDATGYKQFALNTIKAITEDPDPRLQAFAKAANLVKAKLLARTGDTKAVDAMIADYQRTGGTTKPVLLYAPVIDEPLDSGRAVGNGSPTNRLPVNDFDDQWVDIGFYVTPSGHVSDVDVLRQSPKLQGNWVAPILTAIGGRRYAPLALDPQDPGILRVERYTFTSRWSYTTGSRIRVRQPNSQIEVLDLSAGPDVAKPKATS